jgi:hypothetical protein
MEAAGYGNSIKYQREYRWYSQRSLAGFSAAPKVYVSGKPQSGNNCPIELNKLIPIAEPQSMWLCESCWHWKPKHGREIGLRYSFSPIYILAATSYMEADHHTALDLSRKTLDTGSTLPKRSTWTRNRPSECSRNFRFPLWRASQLSRVSLNPSRSMTFSPISHWPRKSALWTTTLSWTKCGCLPSRPSPPEYVRTAKTSGKSRHRTKTTFSSSAQENMVAVDITSCPCVHASVIVQKSVSHCG